MRPAALRLLQEMLAAEERDDWEDAEVVCEGIYCYVGHRRVHRSTINHLHRYLALCDQSDVKGAQRFGLNEGGRIIARDPAAADQIMAMIMRGKPFTFRGGKAVPLGTPRARSRQAGS